MSNKIKFVAFLDVLGFSELVKNNDIEYINEIFDNVFKDIRNKDRLGSRIITSTSEQSSTEDLSIQMISDTIVIWTKDSSRLSLQVLVGACTNLLTSCFKDGLPLRGAISVGNIAEICHAENNMNIKSIIGDAIINAHELEKKQKWMGCVVDNKCFEYLQLDYFHISSGLQREIIQYDFVPIYKTEETHLVLNWANCLYDEKYEDIDNIILENFSKHNKSISLPDIQNKIQNTTKFYNHIKDNNLFVDETIR